MKLYLAHNFSAREALRNKTVPKLEKMGHTVQARWITELDHEKDGPAAEAIKDLVDLKQCDALVFFADQFGDRPGRGKYVEFGYALALNKKIFIVGDDHNCVFYDLPGYNIQWILEPEEIQ